MLPSGSAEDAEPFMAPVFPPSPFSLVIISVYWHWCVCVCVRDSAVLSDKAKWMIFFSKQSGAADRTEQECCHGNLENPFCPRY